MMDGPESSSGTAGAGSVYWTDVRSTWMCSEESADSLQAAAITLALAQGPFRNPPCLSKDTST